MIDIEMTNPYLLHVCKKCLEDRDLFALYGRFLMNLRMFCT